MKTYIKVTLIAFAIGLIFLSTAVYAWLKFTPVKEVKPVNNFDITEEEVEEVKSLLDQRMEIPKKTNVLIMGVDATEALADVVIIASFNSETGGLSLLSVPRDTYVNIDDNIRAQMREDGIRGVPSAIKLTELHSYAGMEYGVKYQKMYLENLLGIKFDYTAEIYLEAFRDIVDAVGGIEMQIRDKGFRYNDPTQNLVIDVPGGLVKLDGKMAEGVVRYRGDYRLGDLERIEVQHEFLKQFIKQVLNRETIKENAIDIVTTCINYVNTDLPITEAIKYIPYVGEIDTNNVFLDTLPGESKDISNGNINISYYILNMTETDKLINKVFYSNNVTLHEDTLKEVKIQVLNGSRISGLAAETQTKMLADGYKVEGIGNYTGEPTEETRIFVSREIEGNEFAEYFNNYEVIVDTDLTGFYDVVIVIGTGEGVEPETE